MPKLERVESDFPYDLYRTRGVHALSAWEMLTERFADSASAVVIGSTDELEILAEQVGLHGHEPPQAIIDRAQTLDFPAGFRSHLKKEMAAMIEQIKQGPGSELFAEDLEFALADGLPIGDWPPEPIHQDGSEPGLTVAENWETGKPSENVLIAVVPTTDWTEIPAYLRYGGWNVCPLPEWHVAALRYWRDRWGARLVGVSHDTLNLRVQKLPESRSDAIELAREQYDYCADIVDQGVGSIAALAQVLMANEWWFFWWD